MTLLEFARGPGLYWATIIFVLGIVWRLVGVLLLPRIKDLSTPRKDSAAMGGIRTIFSRSWPAPELEKNIRFAHITGYVWHIGLFIVILFYAPHIAFFKSIVGFGWPHLPTNLITIASAITLGILVALIVRRMIHPVLKLLSNFDDYLSLLLTILPLLTGVLAYAHLGARYETLLALHILSVELLMVWFPFGKLMHGFTIWTSRYQVGKAFERRGVKV
ncbi:MAG: nitrate reductase [Gammaproteobacteria bacterium]|nr:MAG: nitrate reductase [Gammaproteobacteria bacterium]